jgi:hypothetical protein
VIVADHSDMFFSRNTPQLDSTFFEDDQDRDLLALIDNARTDEEVRRIARMCMQRSRARIEAARAAAR